MHDRCRQVFKSPHLGQGMDRKASMANSGLSAAILAGMIIVFVCASGGKGRRPGPDYAALWAWVGASFSERREKKESFGTRRLDRNENEEKRELGSTWRKARGGVVGATAAEIWCHAS